MCRTLLTIFLSFIFSVCIFSLGQYSVTSGAGRITQDEYKIAIKVLAVSAENANAGAQSDVVVFKNAYNLLKRNISDKSYIETYNNFFQNMANYRSSNDGGSATFCSSLFLNPFVGVPVNPKHHEVDPVAFFSVLKEKIEKGELSLDQMTGILGNLKVRELTVEAGKPKQKYYVLDKSILVNDQILLPSDKLLKPGRPAGKPLTKSP